MSWKSGWCGSGRCERCPGEGPSASKKGGMVKCTHDCHNKRATAARASWKGVKK